MNDQFKISQLETQVRTLMGCLESIQEAYKEGRSTAYMCGQAEWTHKYITEWTERVFGEK